MLSIGFNNYVSKFHIVAIVSYNSQPIKRMVQEAKDSGTCIDATCGRKTRSVIVTRSGHIVLSMLEATTLESRLGDK